jgi:hypothetical protein
VVRHHPRIHGESKYGISRTFKVLGDMITIKMITQFATRPGLWFGLLAIPWLILSGVAAAFWLAGLILGNAPSIVFSSLSVMFVYVFGNMLALLILSETYLANSNRTYLLRLAEVLTVETTMNGEEPT